tara:strand:- start:171 stop:425 length:255 start_codon:yes stop_codon:yes gene_type:complete
MCTFLTNYGQEKTMQNGIATATELMLFNRANKVLISQGFDLVSLEILDWDEVIAVKALCRLGTTKELYQVTVNVHGKIILVDGV